MNLVFGAIFGLAARFSGPKATPGRYFLWLVMTLSFLQATGYWLFSGLGGIGDWAKVTEGLAPAWLFRILLAAIGGAGYYATIVFALTTLRPFVDGAEDHIALARRLTVIPYLAGGILYVVAGLLNPVSVEVVLTSAVAASFGGASALAWMYKMLRAPKQPPPKSAPPVAIERSWPWIAAGSIVAAVFIVVLGRSITFRAP